MKKLFLRLKIAMLKRSIRDWDNVAVGATWSTRQVIDCEQIIRRQQLAILEGDLK